jgi:alanyl-tRNA synthetase
MHYGVLKSGELKVGDNVEASVDEQRRKAICRAHSATHLLQKALQKVLGEHVHQAGSLVEPDRLRFDFTHFSALTTQEIIEIENIVNESILEGYDIQTKEMPIEEAKKIGAMALFGEKYGDIVRVVDMGGYSVEFCGGTHLNNTAKVGAFHIVSEFSVASGVRRIEAITGKQTIAQLKQHQEKILKVAEILKVNNVTELLEKAQQHMDEVKQLHKAIETYKAREAAGQAENFLVGAKAVGELKVITASLNDATAEQLRQMGDVIKSKSENCVAVLASVVDEKITFLAVCGKNAIAKGVKAGELIKNVTKLCGGSGGGKPDSAMGGGKDILKLDDALAIVGDFVAEKTGV